MSGQFKILIVEDEMVSGMFLRRMLEDEGYAVTALTATGEGAVASAVENPPDLVLMDIQLAGEMTGIDAAEMIRRTSQVPVIFISGYDDPAMKERALAVRPLEFFCKPCDIRKLLQIIRTLHPQ